MNLKIKGQLLLAFVGVLAMPTANSLWAMLGSMNAGKSAQTLTDELFPVLESTNKIAVALNDIGRSLEAAMVYEDEEQLARASVIFTEINEQFGKALEAHRNDKLAELAALTKKRLGGAIRVAQKVMEGADLATAMSQDGGREGISGLYDRVKTYRADVAKEFRSELDGVKNTGDDTLAVMAVTLPLSLVFSLVVGIFYGRWLISRLQSVIASLRDIAEGEGDLTKRIGKTGSDELGELAGWFNTFVDKMQFSIGNVAKVATDLNQGETSAGFLSGIASELVSGSRNLNDLAASVATTAEEMTGMSSQAAATVEESSSNVRTVAAAVEEMSTNLTGVASNCADMATSIATVVDEVETMRKALGGVSKRSGEAAIVASRASEVAANTNKTIGLLGAAASDIGNVVDVIKKLSDQTNLLALNATIEAASAGDAGRGFAVVASEVKDLANQTAHATGEISKKIEEIQLRTNSSVTATQEVVGIIAEIDVISKEIVSSVEEQATGASRIEESVSVAQDSVRAINSNVQQASLGAEEVAKNAEELANGADEMARVIASVSDGSRGVSEGMREVRSLADSSTEGAGKVDGVSHAIARLASKLDEAVKAFRV